MKENCHNSRTSDDIDIKLGPVNNFGKRNKTSKKCTMTSYRQIVAWFPIYGKMKASFRKPVSGRIVFKTYILSNTNFVSQNVKIELKNFYTALIELWKLIKIFIFKLLSDAFKAFIRPFEASQRSVNLWYKSTYIYRRLILFRNENSFVCAFTASLSFHGIWKRFSFILPHSHI